MPVAPRFRLMQLFKITALVALFAFAVAVGNEDTQTGTMIALFATALILASVFLGISLEVWAGMAIGVLLSAIRYWWSDSYNQVAPPDRLFEFVVSAIWFSVFGGTVAYAARAICSRFA